MIAAVIAVALVVVALIAARGPARRSVVFAGVWFAVPTLALAVPVLLGIQLYQERYLVFAAPGACLLIAEGILLLRPRRVLAPVAIVALLATMVAPLVDQRGEGSKAGDDYRALAATGESADAVVYVVPDARGVGIAYPDALGDADDAVLVDSPGRSGTLWGVNAPIAERADALRGRVAVYAPTAGGCRDGLGARGARGGRVRSDGAGAGRGQVQRLPLRLRRSLIVQLSIIVPTFNEAPNVAELVRRVSIAVDGIDAEIIFVDDSTDDTPEVIAAVAADAAIPVRCLHREQPTGGLGGAVVAGAAVANAALCLVIDGDLQHPPEKIPELYARALADDVDVVVASRYAGGGDAEGLSSWLRHAVSRTSTLVTKAMFPVRLRNTTDPMTGFFIFDRRRVDVAGLKPRGFKILLEILARQSLRVAEVPFDFAKRHAGDSKASLLQGMRFVWQLALLRFGRMSGYAVIGALGAVLNVLIVWALTSWGVDYLLAAVIATEVTIIGNFVLQEVWVFRDLRREAGGLGYRFGVAFAFNNAEAVVRIPIVYLMVSAGHFTVVIATIISLAVAFIARFTFQSLVVYKPRRSANQRVVDAEHADHRRGVTRRAAVATAADLREPSPYGSSGSTLRVCPRGITRGHRREGGTR